MMTISIPKIPMEGDHIDKLIDFLVDTSARSIELQKILDEAEKAIPNFMIYGIKVDPGREQYPEVHVIANAWMQLANVWPNDHRIENHYTSGPDFSKSWGDHMFRLTLTHEKVDYFCLMYGSEIDQRGIIVPDKEALLRGDG